MDLWLDVTSLSSGERWNTRIETALKECTHCLVVVSPYSMKSAQVAHEVEVADQHQKQIIPVLLQTANLCERLQTTQWVDFRFSYETALRVLLARLRGETLSTTDEWLSAPPRPIRSIWSFVTLFQIVCPRAVKVIAVLVYLSGTFKLCLGLAYTINGGKERTLVGVVVMLFTGLMMCGLYRTVNRRVPFGEAVLMQSLTLFSPLFGFMADPPILYFFITLPLDLALLIAILVSKTYRRWMPAYLTP